MEKLGLDDKCTEAGTALAWRSACDELEGIDYTRLFARDSSRIMNAVRILAKGIADFNCPKLKYRLGMHYFNSKQFRKAIPWLRAAADFGICEAQICLGT
jgi:hypothetical protein